MLVRSYRTFSAFLLTRMRQWEFKFLQHFPSGFPARPLAGILPQEARTFLMGRKAPRDRPARIASAIVSLPHAPDAKKFGPLRLRHPHSHVPAFDVSLLCAARAADTICRRAPAFSRRIVLNTGFECALVGAASFDAAHFAKERFDAVVAVDGGYASLAKAGFSADFALGDFDSLGYVPRDVAVERHPSMKDDSDTALALDWARVHGYSSVAVYGALGGRLDHTHASIAALAHAARSGMRAAAVGEGCIVCMLSSEGCRVLELPARMRGTFSVFSFSDGARGVCETGAKYEVEGVELASDVTLGLSNEFVGRPVRIEVSSGTLVVYLPLSPLASLGLHG